MTQKASTPTVHRQMTIDDIFKTFPQKAEHIAHAMQTLGLHCTGCQAATWETLEAGVLNHGMSEEVLENLIEKLNLIISEETDLSTVTLTKKAAQKFLGILEEENKQGWGLRFGEVAQGCSGFKYDLDFSEKATDDDEVFESSGIQIHVKKKDLPRLMGCEIDYIEDLKNTGFKVNNPNAKSSCGCGSSHNYQ